MLTFQKNIDWQIDFDNFIIKNKNKSFEWGSWDCVLSMCACIKAISGKQLKPKNWIWNSEKEANDCINKYGNKKGLDVAINNAVKKVKGITKIDPNYVQKGDFVVYQEESKLSGIYDGSKVLTPSDNGLIAKYGVNIIACWRINA